MTQPSLHEIALSNPRQDITQAFWGALIPNSDQVLQQRGGGDLALYEEVLRDDQVYACMQQRILAQLSREWHVEAASEREIDRACADFIRTQFHKLDFDDICRKMMLGIFYGYSVAECLWEKSDSQVHLQAIKVRNVRRFGFNTDHKLVLKTRNSPQGENLPEQKFWLFRAGADHDDAPYGRGLGYWLYWPVWFKRNFIRFWSQHAERFAAPTLAGRYPANISEAEKQKLLETLDSMRGRSSMAIPENMAIEILETTRQVGGDYDQFIQRMDQAISKIILSQTMTTDQGSSHAQAKVHHAVRNELVKADADLLCQSLNQSVIKWLSEWNFPNANPPRLWRKCTEELDDETRVRIDQGLYAMGYRLSPALLQERYGSGYEEIAQQS